MSIARKITLYVLLFSGLFTLMGTGFQLYRDYELGVGELEATLSIIEKSQLNSLSQAVWHLDEPNIETQLLEMMSLPGVAHLKLNIPNFDVTTKGVEPEPHLQIERLFDLSFDGKSTVGIASIGKLTVMITLKDLYQDLQNKLVVILFTQAIKTLFVSMFILFLFYYLVTRHLERISSFLTNNPLEFLSESLQLNVGGGLFGRKEAQDELTVLVSSINSMRIELREEIEAKRLTEEQLRQEVIDRREAEKSALESKAHLQLVVESLPDLIWLKDPDGVYLSCNPKFERYLGLKQSQIIGKTDYDFFDRELAGRMRKTDKAAISAGKPCRNEEEITYADDGHKELIETVKTAMSSLDGSLIGVLGVGRDITQRRIAEQGLRRAQKMDAVGQLTGGIAHDFNNILGIIQGNLELLESQVNLEGPANKRIHAIQKSAQRAADLTRQLLGFSRRQAAQVVKADVGSLVSEMDSLIRRSVTPSVEVSPHISEGLWASELDPGDFQDALLNLVLNARDAMPDGGKLIIEVSNCTLDDNYSASNPGVAPGEYIELVVSDTGDGIPDSQLDRIFEPFYTTKPQGKGTGLGLAMVFGFINRSHGHIKVYSELGVGTTFRLYLPRVVGEMEFSGLANDLPETPPPRGSETLLVVEDEPDLLEFAQESLQLLGYRVLVANSGQQALEVQAGEPTIALLFSDVVMPGGMSGYELAAEASANQPGLKVLLTSGYTEKVVADAGQAKYANNLLNKPYSQIELAKRIRGVLDDTL